MSNAIFDFLAHSLLFDQSLISTNYQGESDQRLELELEKYRKHCLDELDNISVEINRHSGNLSCVGSYEMASLSSLKRAALYVEQMVLPDPIFPYTKPENSKMQALSEYLGVGSDSQKIDRVGLAEAVKDVISKRDLVVGGYLKFYPISLLTETPAQIPISYSSDGYTTQVPAPLLQLFRDRSETFTAETNASGLIVRDRLEPCRNIFVRFKGARAGTGYVYNLMTQEVIGFDEETRVARLIMGIPEAPPSQAHFDQWVSESINRSAGEHFRGLTKEFSLAHKLSSVYACSSKLDSQLLRSSMTERDKGIPENAIECILRMKLPYMDKIRSADLMRLRNNDGEAFQNFRTDLEARFRDLRYEKDPEVIRRKIIDVEHEMSEVQVRAISTKIKSVRKAALADFGLAVGGLAAGFATSGMSLLGTLTAALHGAKTYAEYREKVRDNPCYFLFEAQRQKYVKPMGSHKRTRAPVSAAGGKITRLSASTAALRDGE
ncbi:hypothetical protein NVV81_04870 [Pseudomonas carnis]|uniref:hypothetical protein n=1 Tax=Pseudomonas carnis TaxID=2487355 RepID=UPI0021C7929E|nr:hypothetical protein [Pseudomonas carnis]MCR8661692.1 hypothetical protein [Pseudomonas carnis]